MLGDRWVFVPNRSKCAAFILTAIWLASPHVASASAQCPNLSGNYVAVGEDGQVQTTIHQQRCNRVDIVIKSKYLGIITSETHALKLDGKDQKDSPWFGSVEQYRTSAKFVGSELLVTARTTDGSILTLSYTLTPARDLLEKDLRNPGDVQVVAKRQK
jgi:hypothetical protein